MADLVKLKQSIIKTMQERADKYNVIIRKLDPKSETLISDIIIKVKYTAETASGKSISGVIPVKVSINMNNTTKSCNASMTSNIRGLVIDEFKKSDQLRKGPYVSSVAEEIEQQVMTMFNKMFNSKVSVAAYAKSKYESDSLPESAVKVRCSVEEYNINSTATGNILFMDNKHNKILECSIKKIVKDGKSQDECDIVSGTMELDPATLYAGLIKTDKEGVFRVGPRVYSGIIDLAMREYDAACRAEMLTKIRDKKTLVIAMSSRVIPLINCPEIASIFKTDAIAAYVDSNTEDVETTVPKKGRVARLRRKV